MMKVNYDKLWHKLIDVGITHRTYLVQQGVLNYRTLSAMNENKPVHLKVLLKLCDYFNCNFSDIVDIEDDYNNNKK